MVGGLGCRGGDLSLHRHGAHKDTEAGLGEVRVVAGETARTDRENDRRPKHPRAFSIAVAVVRAVEGRGRTRGTL